MAESERETVMATSAGAIQEPGIPFEFPMWVAET